MGIFVVFGEKDLGIFVVFGEKDLGIFVKSIIFAKKKKENNGVNQANNKNENPEKLQKTVAMP